MTDAAQTRAKYLDTHAKLAAGLAAMASTVAHHRPQPATLGETVVDQAVSHLDYAGRYAAQADGVFMAANGDAVLEAEARKMVNYAIQHARKALAILERNA